MPAYEWTKDMPPCCATPQLEIHQRLAIAAAAQRQAQAIESGRERPQFSGGFVASPMNETAKDLLAEVDTALAVADQETGLTCTGSVRAQLVTVAVRAADQIWRDGQGKDPDTAWNRYVTQAHFPTRRAG